jgi:N-acetyl-1-D-myo-inositol-2-amino-2-deoxy-alpha-D-glucopyranoside deacetylase
VLITFGPDGIYGHYDHIAVHRWATIAVDLAADPDCFPEQLADTCSPHRVSKVYFRILPEAQVAAMAEEEGKPPAVMMDGVPFYFAAQREDEITTMVDVSEYVEAKLRGIQCHATQVGRHNRFSDTPDEVMHEQWFRYEHFVLAHSTVNRPRSVETDLFAGLR